MGQVHAEDAAHHGTRAERQCAHLHEQTHPDHLVPDAVQMGGDELVRVLNHLLERLDFSLDLFQVCKVGLQQ